MTTYDVIRFDVGSDDDTIQRDMCAAVATNMSLRECATTIANVCPRPVLADPSFREMVEFPYELAFSTIDETVLFIVEHQS